MRNASRVVRGDLTDTAHVGGLRQAQVHRQLRPHVTGVPVHRLLAAQDQVELPQGPDRTRQGVGGGPRVGAREFPAGDEHALVRAEGQDLPEHGLCLAGAERDDRHRAAEPLSHAQGFLHCEGIERIQDALHTLAHERLGLRIHLDPGGARHLLGARSYPHGNSPRSTGAQAGSAGAEGIRTDGIAARRAAYGAGAASSGAGCGSGGAGISSGSSALAPGSMP